MANLIYSAITSLEGYVADENGSFDWAAPDEEVHRFVNDLERPITECRTRRSRSLRGVRTNFRRMKTRNGRG